MPTQRGGGAAYASRNFSLFREKGCALSVWHWFSLAMLLSVAPVGTHNACYGLASYCFGHVL